MITWKPWNCNPSSGFRKSGDFGNKTKDITCEFISTLTSFDLEENK